ncbi:hypothetical protein BOTBODRAFT_35351 [Botryobasidium botryosum FD-172 SS1]|uniref:Histidine kinase n=1 Tax=Botryobasidium botryosum (strain FD-172 SS1) TaxID=930990 RepID=A0A067MHV9_BOTB1|nr:hypothetical protein BOTBODRAFT_35351 [Botryobasidium botryosum FD-172 SS1]
MSGETPSENPNIEPGSSSYFIYPVRSLLSDIQPSADVQPPPEPATLQREKSARQKKAAASSSTKTTPESSQEPTPILVKSKSKGKSKSRPSPNSLIEEWASHTVSGDPGSAPTEASVLSYREEAVAESPDGTNDGSSSTYFTASDQPTPASSDPTIPDRIATPAGTQYVPFVRDTPRDQAAISARFPMPLSAAAADAFRFGENAKGAPSSSDPSQSHSDSDSAHASSLVGTGIVHLGSIQHREVVPRTYSRSTDRESSAKSGSRDVTSSSNQPATTSSGADASGENNSQDSEVASLSLSNPDSVPYVTTRVEHVQNADGNHVVIGNEGKFIRCEDEPIRTPGAVQGFGILMVVEEEEHTGNLVVRQVSENSTELLGLSPKYLFSLECFSEILPDSQADVLWDNIGFLNDLEIDDEESTLDGPQVFLLSGWGQPGSAFPDPNGTESGRRGTRRNRRQWTCWCAAHRPPAPKGRPQTTRGAEGSQTGSVTSPPDETLHPQNLIILEFELERDIYNPLYPPFANSSEAHFSGSSSPGTTGSQSGKSGTSGSGSGSGSASTPNGGAPGSESSLGTGSGSGGTVTSQDASTPGTSSALTPTSVSSPSVSSDTGTAHPRNIMETGIVDRTLTGTISPASSNQSMGGRANSADEAQWFPSPEDVFESTTNYAKPLRALERMRRITRNTIESVAAAADAAGGGAVTGRGQRQAAKSRRGPVSAGVGTMDVFAVLAQINDQLGAATDLDSFLKVVVGVLRDLTQFHRVLIYQFDEAWNGQVVAELVDWSQSHDLYKGLHFPASDIPPQARELYTINKVRLLYDRDLPTARLVARSRRDLLYPVDMTHSYLRAMSPIHIKYLGNMGVRASMSISIVTFGALWGLIACHSYGTHGMRVSFPVRQMLRLLSDSISRNIERLSYAQRLHTRKLISTIPTDQHPTGYIVSKAEDLLSLFDADYGVLVIGDGAKILGPNEHGQEILIVSEYLRLKQFNLIQVSQAVNTDFPDLLLPSLDVIAGLLHVPLSSGGKDFIALMRRGQLRDIHWAGKPFKDGIDASADLEPRKSFKIWSQTITGRCRAWTDEQMETAGVLALVYGKFIEVWRQKETAVKTTQLTNILLSNASHEVRTPLNHIINYLEMALNGPLDRETRENLSKSHSASKSLLFTINDLLDLTRLESGGETSFNEPFDLPSTIEEAVNLYRIEASRRRLLFETDTTHSPRMVVGDAKKIRTVVANLTANAVKYTGEGGRIVISCRKFKEPAGLRDSKQVAVEIIVSDTGCGIPSEKLESIFREFEQVESSAPKTENQPGLGLGLAVVARIVKQLGGQLRVDSGLGQGSRFSLLTPFALYDPTAQSNSDSRSASSSVHRSRHTSDSSEIDSLVEALGSSHMGEAGLPGSGEKRSDSTAAPKAGQFDIGSSNHPIRPVKVDAFGLDSPLREIPSSQRQLVDDTVAQAASGSESTEPAPPKLRILIVEDDPINRTILRKRLLNEGHIVETNTNGQEAVNTIEADKHYDCILMDIQMPILNGFEATERIRELEKSYAPSVDDMRQSLRLNGRIPIFAVSASLLERQRQDMSDLGMDGWILKPINFSRLTGILKGITDLSQRQNVMYYPGYNWENGGWLNGSLATPEAS